MFTLYVAGELFPNAYCCVQKNRPFEQKLKVLIINKIYYYINTTEKFEQNLDFVQDC